MNTGTILESPKRSSLAGLANWRGALVMTAVTALFAQLSFPIPFSPVPFSMQPFAILLTGVLLGKKWGVASTLQYLLLGALGAPVFAMGHAGVHVLFGFTGGYLLAYPFAVFLIGTLMERLPLADFKKAACACLAGLGVIYTFGCSWLALRTGGTMNALQVAVAGAGWFMAWDFVKVLVVAQTFASANRR